MEQLAWTSARENLVSARLLCTQRAVCFDLCLEKKEDYIKVGESEEAKPVRTALV